MSQLYQEYSQTRQMYATRIMYGLTSKLTIEVTASTSNHHDTLLPPNLTKHTHNAQGGNVYTADNLPRGLYYPFIFAGYNFYAKYRVYSNDGEKSHFRVAVFADYSTIDVAHDEAEPELLDDNGGYEGGLIVTKLIDRWAFSFTTDYIVPTSFVQTQTKYIWPPQVTTLQYGRALEYDFSIGYRFFPDKYMNDYTQNNFNVYVEFLGKSYNGAQVNVNGVVGNIQTPLLEKGYYVEMYPGIQWIINSNARAELSVGYPILGESYVHFYPVYDLAVQRYFYFSKSKPNPPVRKPPPVPVNYGE